VKGRAVSKSDILAPIGIVMVYLALALSRHGAGPATAVTLALTAGAVAASAALVHKARNRALAHIPAGAILPLGGALIALVWGSFRAVNPYVSVFGLANQRVGLSFWIASVTWLLVGLAGGTKTSLRRIIWVVSAGASGLALLAILERAMPTIVRTWGSSAGALENSLTLGQILVLGVAASVALLAVEKSSLARAGALALLLASIAGLLIAESRAAWLGLIIGGITAVALVTVRSERAQRFMPQALVSLGVLSQVGLFAVAAGLAGPKAFSVVNELSNQRLVIWKSALVAVGKSPVVPRGLEQFSAWISWGFSNGGLTYYGAYDPHNTFLALLLGGGVAALIFVLLATTLLLKGMMHSYLQLGRPRFIAVLIGGIVGVGAASLLAWPASAAFVGAAVICGMLIALTASDVAGETESTSRSVHLEGGATVACGAILSISALVLSLWMLPAISADARFARLATASPSASSASFAELTRTVPDPSYVARAIGAALAGTGEPADSLAQAQALSNTFERDSAWHIDTAWQRIALEQARSAAQGVDTWPEVVRAVENGRKADPTSGMWDFLGAVEAQRLGKTTQAIEYAKRALTFDMGTDASSIMSGIASGKVGPAK